MAITTMIPHPPIQSEFPNYDYEPGIVGILPGVPGSGEGEAARQGLPIDSSLSRHGRFEGLFPDVLSLLFGSISELLGGGCCLLCCLLVVPGSLWGAFAPEVEILILAAFYIYCSHTGEGSGWGRAG